MWTRWSRIRLVILLLLAFLYAALLVRNLSESDRRSLRLSQEASAADHVFVGIKIISVNMNNGEVKARMRFRLAGTIANDEITPAVDLKLLLNTVQGQQEYDFSSGKRMTPIEAVFSLDGDSNRYPFDRHHAALWLLITKPSPHGRLPISRASPASSPTSPASVAVQPGPRASNRNTAVAREGTRRGATRSPVNQPATPAPAVVPEQSEPAPGLVVGTAVLEEHEPVGVYVDLSASIPGIKFSGSISDPESDDVKQVDLYLRRADNVIAVSTIVMAMMMCLAMSLLAMAVTSTASGKESALLPLSVAVTLIFGLPALRDVQPDVPPLGVLGDYVSFIWAEVLVAGSTLIVVWTWITRSRKSQRHARESASST